MKNIYALIVLGVIDSFYPTQDLASEAGFIMFAFDEGFFKYEIKKLTIEEARKAVLNNCQARYERGFKEGAFERYKELSSQLDQLEVEEPPADEGQFPDLPEFNFDEEPILI